MKPLANLLIPVIALTVPFLAPAATININVGTGEDVFVSTNDIGNTYYFIGKPKPYTSSALFAGLRYVGGGSLISNARFTRENLQTNPVVGALDGTVVSYTGFWSGDGGQTKSSLIVRTGGRWIVEAGARLDFLQTDSLFTRQMWVYGDGTGILELAEGFVADRSQGGTVADGLGSIRMSNSILVTHHTQNLPVNPRPDGSGGFQTNGHMVFENAGGSTWSTQTNPQTYSGAVWIGENVTVDTQTDLTHDGTTQYSSHMGNYWADNAFQTTNENVTVTKTGPADLILAEEVAFLPGGALQVQEGGVIFQSDPAAGKRKNSSNAVEGGPNMQLGIESGASVEVDTPLARMASIQQQPSGTLILEAQSDGTFPLITLETDGVLDGTVILRNSGAYALSTAASEVISATGGLASSGVTFVDETGTGFEFYNGTIYTYTGPFTGRDPKFFYYQSDGRFIYLGMGDVWTAGSEQPLDAWNVLSPTPTWIETQPGGSGTWSTGYAGGVASWEEETGAGLHGRFHVATFDPGLDESAFSDVTVRFVNGPVRTVPVYVIRRGVVIDEDWTDGAFDAPTGWRMVNNPDIGFFSTGRSNPATAFGRRLGGFLWPVAYYDTDHFAAGPEDVLVIKMTTFSDVAFSNAEYSKPEVAALHDNPDHQFNHNHAAELSRHYSTRSFDSQLRPSVDNQENSLTDMHHSGGSTASRLNNAETSLGVFRTVGNGTEVETFGEFRRVSTTITNKYMMEDNFIQISMPHSYASNRSPVHRAGTNSSNSYIGMSFAHVGVTARTDANLDYCTDAYDFIYWNTYNGFSGSWMYTGDFNNDGLSNLDDLALWQAEAGNLHDPEFSEPRVNTPLLSLPGVGVPPSFTYDMATGELYMQTNGAAISAMVIPLSGPVVPDPALTTGTWWHAIVRGDYQWVDTGLTGLTGNHLIATLAPDLQASAFGDIWTGLVDGGARPSTVAVTGSPSADYSEWATRHGLSGPEALPEAITNGINNLVRYGMGFGLHQDASAMPGGEMVDDGGTMVLRMEWTRLVRGSDLITGAEASDSLSGWSSGDVTVTVTDNGDGTETVRVQVDVPDGVSAEKVFLRLQFDLAAG